jgi:phage/plasmid primase-like uncharacterized protein
MDAQTIKAAAAGRWPDILSRLGMVAPELLDGKHHPCPRCGGLDRFRLIDADAGALFCNQCFTEKNGDGLAALQWLAGCSFPEALKMVAGHIGANPGGNGHLHNGNGKALDKTAKLVAGIAKLKDADRTHESYGRLIHGFCQTKPPITPAGIEKAGGRIVRGCGQVCLRFDGYKQIGDTEPSAVVLLRADGKMFSPIGSLGERKSHTLGGSSNAWVMAGDIETAHTIIDTEGVSDLLAAASMLPDGWAAITSTGGAAARGKLSRPWAKDKRIIVAGDADRPGQIGIRRATVAYFKGKS